MELSDKGKAALRLAARGWKVFPLLANTNGQPLVKAWEQAASDDPIEISQWWERTPDANIGLATGPSGLVVVDFDAAKTPDETSGIENFRQAFKRKLTDTYTVKSAGGGWHLYYLAGTAEVRNSASKLVKKVDIRAQGGYVCAPGSTIDGNSYEALTMNKVAQPIPPWLVHEIQKERVNERSLIVPKGDSTRYAQAALAGECKRVAEMEEGGRNHATNRAAWNVSRFVAKGELDYEEARSAVIAAAEVAGLSKREASHAAASGLQRGIKYYGGANGN